MLIIIAVCLKNAVNKTTSGWTIIDEIGVKKCPCLHEQLLLIIWNGMCDHKFVYLKCRLSCS